MTRAESAAAARSRASRSARTRSYASWRPTWELSSEAPTGFSSDLLKAAYLGFSSDPNVVFHAPAGRAPVRSDDAGVTWSPIQIPLLPDETIRYWAGDTRNADLMLCATDKGLLRSTDR